MLDGLRCDGLLDRDPVLGGLAALGISVRGQKLIGQMIDSLG